MGDTQLNDKNPQPEQTFQDNTNLKPEKDNYFPPHLCFCKDNLVLIDYLMISLALGSNFSFLYFFIMSKYPIIFSYLLLVAGLLAIVHILSIRKRFRIHEFRRKDTSEIHSLFIEAEEFVLGHPDEKFKHIKELVRSEIKRLKEMGSKHWLEYQVLPLQKLLVNFYDNNNLKANAESVLDDLKEYADDPQRRYNVQDYDKWNDDIHKLITLASKEEEMNLASKEEEMNLASKEEEMNLASKEEELKAKLKMLHEHVASYHAYWGEGKAIMEFLRRASLISIICFGILGTLPVLRDFLIGSNGSNLEFYHWGFLGICGSLTATMLGLRNTEATEVGSTEGDSELKNAMLGCILGLVAGVISYCLIRGGLVNGSVVPILFNEELEYKDFALSVLMAIAAGFSFEKVFNSLSSLDMTRG